MTTRPSGSTATARTAPSWRPSSTGPAPGAAGSHTSTRPSSPPVTTRPSGSTATARTQPSWRPSSTGPAPGLAGSHTSTRPSRPPVTTRPSGSTATALHRVVVAAELDRAGAGRGRVPHQHPPVVAAGDHPPVRQHRHRRHRAVVAAELTDRAGLARRVVHWSTRPGPGRDGSRVADVVGEVVFAEFGRLQAQLAQHVAGLVHRLRGAQVVGLAADDREHRRRPRCWPGSAAAARRRSARTAVDAR